MRVIVTTSDGRKDILRGFAARFNRYWDAEQRVDVLGFEPVSGLPDNFRFHSLGRQSDFGKIWTDPLIPWFDALEDEPFVLMLDDYWITDYVNGVRVAMLYNMVYSTMADKADLTQDRFNHPHKDTGFGNVLVSTQTARYRTSLQAAIWRTGYFRRYLAPGRSIWAFECKGYREAFNDGATILGTVDGVVKYENVTVNGEAVGQLKEQREAAR